MRERTQARRRTAALTARKRKVGAGGLLRQWRAQRKLSQLAVALGVGVSPKHLSFVETGRSSASPGLLVALSEFLALPLRERNALLLAGGFAPRYTETPFTAPALEAVRTALQRLLDAHDPYPGLALDRHWNAVLMNNGAARLSAMLPEKLRTPTLNIFRASLHPEDFAAHTLNFDAWGSYLLRELTRLAQSTTDTRIAEILVEVSRFPNVIALKRRKARAQPSPPELLVPAVLNLHGKAVALFPTLATIGSPLDVTLAELTLELYYPADAATDAALRQSVST